MLPRQEILDSYHESMGEAFTGVPNPPKNFIEPRLQYLQDELNGLSEDHEDYANYSAKLQREISETQTIIDTQAYTEDSSEIAYWQTYTNGLKEFIRNL